MIWSLSQNFGTRPLLVITAVSVLCNCNKHSSTQLNRELRTQANTLLKDKESTRDSHVFACIFDKYLPILNFQGKRSWKSCSSSGSVSMLCIYGLVQAFSTLMLLVGRRKEHPTCNNWVVRCWCGCLPGARCRLFAYGPPDATAIPKSVVSHLNPDWFYLSGTGLPRLSWKKGR